MHARTDIVATDHVIPQQRKDPLVRSILSRQIVVEIEIRRRHGKLHIIHIEATNNTPKILIACLFELKVPSFMCPILHIARRQIETIGGETVVPLEAWLDEPFLAECDPKSPGEIPNAKKSSECFSRIR